MSQCYCVNINDFDWDGKDFAWPERFFYIVPISLFFHNPLNLPGGINLLMKGVKKKDYQIDYPIQILLQDGRFKGKLMVEVNNPDPDDYHIRTVRGVKGKTFISRRPINKIKKDVSKILEDHKKKKVEVQNVFLWYVNCPVCVGRKGHKTVIFVQS